MKRLNWLVVICFLSLGIACSGGDGGASDRTTASPAASPTVQPVLSPGVCADEMAYNDPARRFGFCYPADMEQSATTDGRVTVMYPIGEDNRVVVAVGWESTAIYDNAAACTDSTTIKSRGFQPFAISGTSVRACLEDHYDEATTSGAATLTYRSTEMEFAVSDGFIRITAAVFGPDFVRDGVPGDDIASRIMGSIVIS